MTGVEGPALLPVVALPVVTPNVAVCVLNEGGTVIDLVGNKRVTLWNPPVGWEALGAVPTRPVPLGLSGVKVTLALMDGDSEGTTRTDVWTLTWPSLVWVTGESLVFAIVEPVDVTLAAFVDENSGLERPNWTEYWNWPVPVTMIWSP